MNIYIYIYIYIPNSYCYRLVLEDNGKSGIRRSKRERKRKGNKEGDTISENSFFSS